MIELISGFQSYSKLEAYATKYMANNKQAKVIVKFQDSDKKLEKESVVSQLFGKGPEK